MNNQNTLARRYLPPILLLALISRVAAAIYMGDQLVLPGIFDQQTYHELAIRLLDGYGYTFARLTWPLTRGGEPTAHWSYLYTGYLYLVYGLAGVQIIVPRLIQAIIAGLAQPLLAFWLGRRLFSPRAGLAAAAISAVYFYFIYYSAALMTEMFYILAIMAALLLVLRLSDPDTVTGPVDWLGLGLLLGAAALLRQLFLLLVPLLLGWIWWQRRLTGRAGALSGSAAVLVILGLMILPFSLYNYRRFDQFVLLNTNAGFALFWGNHPVYGTQFIPILSESNSGTSYSRLIPEEVRPLDEAAMEKELLRRGLQFMIDDPGRIFRLSLSRIPIYFQFWPSADSSLASNIGRVGSFGLFLPFMVLGIILWPGQARRLDRDPGSLLLLLCLAYALLHILTWTLIRYRLPIDALLVIFAGHSLTVVWQRLAAGIGQGRFC